MTDAQKAAELAGRTLMAAMFLISGIGKITGLRGHAGLHGGRRRAGDAAPARDCTRSARVWR
jgi:uncharacterized membrane protein YphA (DoxX/SURF4 family)